MYYRICCEPTIAKAGKTAEESPTTGDSSDDAVRADAIDDRAVEKSAF
jgi:hypothetical protein